VKVSDGKGLFAETTTKILVKNFAAVPGDLIAHYPFTGNANDVSGNQLHGQANGVVLTTDLNGIQQSAYYFNGGAQHIAVPNDPLLNFQDGITVSCWFRANALPEKETFLLSHGSWQNRWKLSITPEKYMRWTMNTLSSIADLDIDLPVKIEQFYHVTATYDGSLLALYLNGNLRTYKVLSGKIRTTTFPFLMGQMLPAQPEYNFKGVIDAVKIHNYALAPDAVKTLYDQSVSAGEPVFTGEAVLVLSPNPMSDLLTVRLAASERLTLSQPLTGLVQVRDLAGKVVLEKNSNSGETIQLDLSGFRAGIYVVVWLSEEGWFSGRFVKN